MRSLFHALALSLGCLLATVAAAQVPISGLPAATTPLSGTEVAPFVQSGVTKKTAALDIAITLRGQANTWSQAQTFTVAPIFGNAAGTRTNLGVAIGSNVQAWDADLDALAALSGTNTIYYRSAANTWTPVTIGGNLTFTGGTLNGSAGGGGATITGTPASGNLAAFSGASSLTNGDLSGDCTTAGTLAITCTKTGGVAFAASATTNTTSATNITAGTLAAARGGAGTITGILKANGSGVVSAAVSATDYAPATTGAAILKGNSAGGFSAAVSSTDYAPATSGSSILKGNAAGGFANAVSSTDYAPATSGGAILYGNGSGGFSNVTIGTGLTFTTGTLTATGGGGGTPGGTSGQLQYNNAGVFGGFTMAGDCTLAQPTITCTKLNSVSPGTAFSVNTGTSGATLPLLNAANTWSATQTLNGAAATLALVAPNIAEPITVAATAATGTINFDAITQSVVYFTTNASANWTLNLRGSSTTSMNTLLATGQAITLTHAVTQGASAFYNNVVQVDGTTSGVTTKWQGGAPSFGNSSGVDVYTYTVIKTGSATFTVLASQTPYL